jgi:hypothetical protein
MSIDANKALPATPSTTKAVHLTRESSGRLVYVDAHGASTQGVTVVRAFPLSEPSLGISIINLQGHEVAWFDDLNHLDDASRALVEEDLSARDFRPVIAQIVAVSTFATPTEWTVQTDRGLVAFTLKAEEDIRRLDGARLLVTSADGLAYEIKDRWALDRSSRRFLERFL